MNTWQQLRQMQYLAEADTWPNGSAGKVLDACHLTAMEGQELIGMHSVGNPFLRICAAGFTADPSEPGLIRQRYDVELVTFNEGAMTGEPALVGGRVRSGASSANAYGQGASKGRGLHEIEAQVLGTLRRMTGADGNRVVIRLAEGAEPSLIDRNSYAVRRYTLEAMALVDLYYTPPARFAVVDSGGGACALSWANPPSRWDFYQVHIRRASGATPPSSVSAGTPVYTGTGTSTTDSPGVGQQSYAIFAAYDELNDTPAEEQRWSEQETGTTATVTVTT